MAWTTTTLNAGPIPGSTYDFTIPGLSANTIYQYRSYMIVGGVEYFGQTYQINTLPVTQVPPDVITVNANAIDSYTINVNSNLVSAGTKPIIERGIVWGTSPNPTMPADVAFSNSDGLTTLGVYSLYMSNDDYPSLNPNTTYYVRAYACSSNINGSLVTNAAVVCTIQTPPLPAKHINFVCYGSSGANGANNSTICHCITTTPAMSAGECFCICLGLPLFVDPDLVNDGMSCATYCVYCKGVSMGGYVLINSCDLYTQQCAPDSLACKQFQFCYGDSIRILQQASTKAGSSGLGGTNSCSCIRGVTSLNGSFDIGTTCCKSCVYSG